MTTNYVLSRGESQFVFKAVGDVLLEIQKYVSNEAQVKNQFNSFDQELEPWSNWSDKNIRFVCNNHITTEGIITRANKTARPNIKCISKGDLDRTRSKAKALSDPYDSSFGLSRFKSDNLLARNRHPLKIESFFTFGRQNQIYTPSPYIIISSLIYIDRFIKSQRAMRSSQLSDFDIQR